MFKARGTLVGLLMALALGALVLAGCTASITEGTEEPLEAGSTGAPTAILGEPATGANVFSGVSTASSGVSGQSGIWVNGVGKVTVEPDLAVLNLGVEAREATVSAARSSAANAMTRVIAALKDHGIADLDIRTQFFNIQPIIVYQEKFQNGQRYSEPEIVGYRVSNQVTVKVRDLDSIGPILDDAVTAGGDLIRVNGISFTIEDPAPYTVQAREAAVQDALAKAQQFATLTNVAVGKLVYITETGGTPAPRVYAEEEFAVAAAAVDVTTPISGGQMEITISIQAAFAIP